MNKTHNQLFNVNFSKRGAIRQLLNRESVYSVADYSRKVSRKIGVSVSKGEILTCLNHMQYEGQFQYEQYGRFIVKVA